MGRYLLYAYASTIVEEEHVDTHKPAAEGPDGIAGGGSGERFQDRTQSQ